ncbi:MAG: HYR domain-containing protein, partial [Chloroflexi bacterium]
TGAVTITRSPSGNVFAVGTTTVTWTATDGAGNTATATQAVIVVDDTAPTIVAPANIHRGTGPGATTATVLVSDADLGTASATDNCPGTLAPSRSGAPAGHLFPFGVTTITYTVADGAGNTNAATQTVTIDDTTAPTITGARLPAANAAGWNNTDVVVTFTCADVGSGIASCTSPVALSGDGAAQSANGTATDHAGNSTSTTVSGINIDKTKPVITYSGNAGAYTIDQMVVITCSASDGLSGMASNTCTGVNAPAYTLATAERSQGADRSKGHGRMCVTRSHHSAAHADAEGGCDRRIQARRRWARRAGLPHTRARHDVEGSRRYAVAAVFRRFLALSARAADNLH